VVNSGGPRAARLAALSTLAATIIFALPGCTAHSGEGERPMNQRPASQSPAAAGLPIAATVTYSFQDSSVPPPYHRSFVITFDRSQARMVVDSYGTVLADRTAPMPPGAWTRMSDTVADLDGSVIEEPEQGCTGGTGFSLAVTGGGPTLTGSACGGANSNAEERVTAWIQPVRSLFPSMDELAPEGAG